MSPATSTGTSIGLWVVARPLVAVGLAVAAVLAIGAIDAVMAAGRWPLAVEGMLDESAHLLTTAVLLAAVLPRRLLPLVPWVLAGSLLIDIDHVPGLVTGVNVGRPVTHSLATVLVLVLVGASARGRWRTALLGLATGVSLHLVRDFAVPSSGPGVQLLWPALPDGVVLPYPGYVAVLVAALVVVVVRQWRRMRRVAAPPVQNRSEVAS